MPLDPNELETPQHQTPMLLPVCDELKTRMTELNAMMEQAKVQGYVEANFAIKLLDLVKELVPLLLGAA